MPAKPNPKELAVILRRLAQNGALSEHYKEALKESARLLNVGRFPEPKIQIPIERFTPRRDKLVKMAQAWNQNASGQD